MLLLEPPIRPEIPQLCAVVGCGGNHQTTVPT
jgi:hypothetical protein